MQNVSESALLRKGQQSRNAQPESAFSPPNGRPPTPAATSCGEEGPADRLSRILHRLDPCTAVVEVDDEHRIARILILVDDMYMVRATLSVDRQRKLVHVQVRLTKLVPLCYGDALELLALNGRTRSVAAYRDREDGVVWLRAISRYQDAEATCIQDAVKDMRRALRDPVVVELLGRNGSCGEGGAE